MSKKARLEDRFLEMRIQGMTYEEIAQALDVSKQTLINWSKDDDFQEQVNIARAIRLQAIVNKYQLNREANLQRYGKLLDRLSQEIDKCGAPHFLDHEIWSLRWIGHQVE